MKTIIIANQKFHYKNNDELKVIIGRFPNFQIGETFNLGDYFTAGDDFTAGNYFKAGNDFTAGDYFKAGDDFKAGDNFKAGDYFTAGNDFKAGDYFTAGNDFEIENHIIIPNNYGYISRCYYEINSKVWYIQLGCYLRSLADWEKDFWNNPKEFPNDGSEKSQKRLKLFQLYKHIIEYLKI